MRLLNTFACATLCAFFAGCSNSPSTPTPQPPTALTVTLGLSSAFTGHTTTATATAKKADGSTEVVAATWSSDRTSVATVSSSGLVTAVGAGTTNIVATYSGLTASAPFNVTPDFSGTWTGTAQLESCEGFSDPRSCGNFVPTGTTATISVALTQDGVGVRGTIDLRTAPPSGSLASPRRYVGDVSGTFDADGWLSLQGPTRIVLANGSVADSGEIREWRTRIVAGSQDGSFSHVFPPAESWQTTGTVKWTGMSLKK